MYLKPLVRIELLLNFSYRKNDGEVACQKSYNNLPYFRGISNNDNSSIGKNSGASLPGTPRGVDNAYLSYGFIHEDKHLIPQESNRNSFRYTSPSSVTSKSSNSQQQNQVCYSVHTSSYIKVRKINNFCFIVYRCYYYF